MRLIDSEAAYRFLTEQLVKETGAFSKGVNKGINIARSAVRNPDAIQPLTQPNNWISVEDRLPESEKPVLTFVGYPESMVGFITVSTYYCFDKTPHWQWDGLLRDEQRTLFWMPLPQPPKEAQP